MAGTKLNWERARKEDLVRSRGSERAKEMVEQPAAPFASEKDSLARHLDLKAKSKEFLLDARGNIGRADESGLQQLRRQVEQLAFQLQSDPRMRQESIRLEMGKLAEDLHAYLKWRSKRPERRDLMKLYVDSMSYISGAGDRFPAVISCAAAIENLAYLHRWKHAFPSLPLSAQEMQSIRACLHRFAEVRPLSVRHV